MDYMTKPASRTVLRAYSILLRKIFGFTDPGVPFDVLMALEMIILIFPGTIVEIVDDNELPRNIPASCFPDASGNFTIIIKESIYKGAYERKIGAYLGFICHEICHIFLYKIGYTPVFSRSFKNNYIPAYKSVEWQAKALCGPAIPVAEHYLEQGKYVAFLGERGKNGEKGEKRADCLLKEYILK